MWRVSNEGFGLYSARTIGLVNQYTSCKNIFEARPQTNKNKNVTYFSITV